MVPNLKYNLKILLYWINKRKLNKKLIVTKYSLQNTSNNKMKIKMIFLFNGKRFLNWHKKINLNKVLRYCYKLMMIYIF
jgi:hypothetical protein